jgi:hypothetical protein
MHTFCILTCKNASVHTTVLPPLFLALFLSFLLYRKERLPASLVKNVLGRQTQHWGCNRTGEETVASGRGWHWRMGRSHSMTLLPYEMLIQFAKFSEA